MHTLTLRKIGNSVGIILPKELLETLHLTEGDHVFANIKLNGLQLMPNDPEFEATIKVFGQSRKKYRNALRKLAE